MVEHVTDNHEVDGSNPSTPTTYPGIVQFGRMLDLGSSGREFESLCPDHSLIRRDEH